MLAHGERFGRGRGTRLGTGTAFESAYGASGVLVVRASAPGDGSIWRPEPEGEGLRFESMVLRI